MSLLRAALLSLRDRLATHEKAEPVGACKSVGRRSLYRRERVAGRISVVGSGSYDGVNQKRVSAAMDRFTEPGRWGVLDNLREGEHPTTVAPRGLLRRKDGAGQPPPVVSVVMPVYNAAATLEECLTRLGQSTFEDFEVVVVDDGSTDESNDILARFPVRVVSSTGRIGPAAARNLGAHAATGEFLFFIDLWSARTP
jgi:hypothetical protein